MLRFEFERDIRTQTCRPVSLSSSASDYTAFYSFRADATTKHINERVLRPVLDVLETVPDEPEVYRFPEFYVETAGVVLDGADVYQHVSSSINARIMFVTTLKEGRIGHVLTEETPTHAELSDARKMLDFLIRSSMYLLDRNAFLLDRLRPTLNALETHKIEERNGEILSFLKDASRVLDLSPKASTQDPSLAASMSRFAMEAFDIKTALHLEHGQQGDNGTRARDVSSNWPSVEADPVCSRTTAPDISERDTVIARVPTVSSTSIVNATSSPSPNESSRNVTAVSPSRTGVKAATAS